MIYEFAYSSWPRLRPVLTLEIESHDRKLGCMAIVDSGADECVFPLSYALELGLDPLKAETGHTSGVGGASNTYHWDVTLRFQFGAVRLRAGFMESLNTIGFGLLGQTGFFDYAKVLFDQKNGLFSVEPYGDVQPQGRSRL